MTSALRVKRLRVERLRNITRAELEPSSGQNLLVGGNGQGKTTFLEAMYLLGAVRSFRGARPADIIQSGADNALIKGTLGVREPDSEIIITLSRQGREIRTDGKKADLATHFRKFPIVAFHPGDLELVFGGPAIRRRFLDRMLFQAEEGYAQWFREYRRALGNRNESLKRNRPTREIRVWDPILAELGAKMGNARARLSVLLAEATEKILEQLGVEPFVLKLEANVNPESEDILEALKRTIESDRRRGRTSIGPHTDDLKISRPSGLAKIVASRGEARALTVSLRLGERKVIAQCAHAAPLLLLDDVWAELDRERAEKVLTMVASESGQVVVTGTGGSEPAAVAGWRRFEVQGGQISSFLEG